MSKKITKYRSGSIKVVKFNIGDNDYDKTTVFYKNGRVKQEKNYKNGELNGNLVSYWDNGLVHTKGQYENNKRIGVWNTYNKRGKLVLSENHMSGRLVLSEEL